MLSNLMDVPENCPSLSLSAPLSANLRTVKWFWCWNMWIQGKIDKRVGQYEAVPTVDVHLSQFDLKKIWLFILDEYIRPLAEKVYRGYKSKVNVGHSVPVLFCCLFGRWVVGGTAIGCGFSSSFSSSTCSSATVSVSASVKMISLLRRLWLTWLLTDLLKHGPFVSCG